MLRSEINKIITESINFFDAMNFHLPKWAFWKLKDWETHRNFINEIVQFGLGWDITDFGSNNFDKIGLLNFNLRNYIYCEKVLICKENQATPFHTHRQKVEDIINRGGGNLVIELEISNDIEASTLPEKQGKISIDSIPITFDSKTKIILTPGQSIRLKPGIFHQFYGQEGYGKVLVGEVSTTNDDTTDNIFVNGNPRFPEIEEDEEPMYLLVGDYKHYLLDN